MTDSNNLDMPQPSRPFMRGAQKYDVLREPDITAVSTAPEREELFKITFIASKKKGVSMDNENTFLIDLIFKPNEGKLRLRPQETQLLLAYYAELLQEITDEEQAIIEEEKAKQEQGDVSCK